MNDPSRKNQLQQTASRISACFTRQEFREFFSQDIEYFCYDVTKQNRKKRKYLQFTKTTDQVCPLASLRSMHKKRVTSHDNFFHLNMDIF